MSIGDRVNERMSAVGISQAQLAREAGVTSVSMMRIRNGDATNVRATTALRLARSLKCNIVWLVEGRGPVEGDKETENIATAQLLGRNSLIGSPIDQRDLVAVSVSDDMTDLPRPCLIYASKSEIPKSGDLVLIEYKSAYMVRKLRDMNGTMMTEATAANIPEQFRFDHLTPEMTIVGRVTGYFVQT